MQRVTSKTIERTLPLADLSGLPTSNPGDGGIWLDVVSGALLVGVRGNLTAPQFIPTGGGRLQGEVNGLAVLNTAGTAYGQLKARDAVFSGATGTDSFAALSTQGGVYASQKTTVNTYGQVRVDLGSTADNVGLGVGIVNDVYTRAVIGVDTDQGFIGFGPGSGPRDVKIRRNATGPKTEVWAAGGLGVRNASGLADGPFTASAVTATGGTFTGAPGSFIVLGSLGVSINSAAAAWPISINANVSGLRVTNGTNGVDLVVTASGVLSLYTPATLGSSQNSGAPSGTLSKVVCGSISVGGVNVLGVYTIASLPPAASNAGAFAVVSNSTPANLLVQASGGAWRYVHDNSAV